MTASEIESERVRAQVGGPPVETWPNVVSLPREGPRSEAHLGWRLLFVGSMGHLPNRVAVYHAAREILPRLQRIIDGRVVLRIAGAGGRDGDFLDLKDVEWLGVVAELTPLYANVVCHRTRGGRGRNGESVPGGVRASQGGHLYAHRRGRIECSSWGAAVRRRCAGRVGRRLCAIAAGWGASRLHRGGRLRLRDSPPSAGTVECSWKPLSRETSVAGMCSDQPRNDPDAGRSSDRAARRCDWREAEPPTPVASRGGR